MNTYGITPNTQGDNIIVGERHVVKQGVVQVGILNRCDHLSEELGMPVYHPIVELWDVREAGEPLYLHRFVLSPVEEETDVPAWVDGNHLYEDEGRRWLNRKLDALHEEASKEDIPEGKYIKYLTASRKREEMMNSLFGILLGGLVGDGRPIGGFNPFGSLFEDDDDEGEDDYDTLEALFGDFDPFDHETPDISDEE